MDRLFFADFLRVIATIGVITIHVTAALHQNAALYKPESWWISNVWICSTTWSVPMFVMLSGMLHLKPDKQYDASSFINKSLAKILIPLVFWGFLYKLFHYINIQRRSIHLTDIVGIFKDIYEGKAAYHLWFLYLIIGLYLFTPILRAYVKQVKDKEVCYFLYIWLIVSIIAMVDSLIGVKNHFYLQYVSGYIGYYILGYYLSLIKLEHDTNKILLLGGFISISSLISLTYVLKTNGYPNWYSLCNNLSVFTIINCTAIFVYFKDFDWNYFLKRRFGLLFKAYITDFSKNSFGIYIIHIFVLGFIGSNKSPVKLSAEFIHPAIGIPVTIISATVIAHLLVKFLRRFRIVRIVLP